MASGAAISRGSTRKVSDARGLLVIAVFGRFRLTPDALQELRPAMARVIIASRAEAGCIAYDRAEDVLEPGLIRVSELWESREALAAHAIAPHLGEWTRLREERGMTGRQIDVYEVRGPELP